ncbi:MAG TPA: hypothetical protein VF178_04130 [Gemmatimonadaceae bacterium]
MIGKVSGFHAVLVVLAVSSLSCAPRADGRTVQRGDMLKATEQDPAVQRDVQRVREATAAFKSLDSAVAAGYRRDVANCVENQPHGAMGYHHQKDALLDDHLEVEAPEMLVYERLPSGEYRLNGVEYIVPFSARPATATPPVIMGQQLKPAPSLNLWYLHVWIWNENPSGLFADWHPGVHC